MTDRSSPDTKTRFRRNGHNGDSPITNTTKEVVKKNGNGNGHKKNGNGKNGKNGNGNGTLVLTPSEKIFADEWLIDRNGTRAYKVAYPRVKNDNAAGVSAFQLLRKPKIDKYVQKRLERLSAKVQMDTEWVLQGYKKLVDFSFDEIYDDDGHLKPISEWSENAKFAAVGLKQMKKISRKKTEKTESESETIMSDLKFDSKKDVFDSVGKYLRMFGDEGQGKGINVIGQNIQVNLTD
jgi:phage terminase small subunit